jgi:hypothetical protein
MRRCTGLHYCADFHSPNSSVEDAITAEQLVEIRSRVDVLLGEVKAADVNRTLKEAMAQWVPLAGKGMNHGEP